MNELIKLNEQTINNEMVQTVNARELHAFLQSKQDFSTWVKNRIEQYDFVENQDFVRFHKKMEANNATMIEYYITLNMALVERNLLTNFTITAKEFGIKRKDLIDYLLTNKYVYRDAHGNIVAYAAYVPDLFEIKEFAKEKHAGTQTLITPRGRETFRLLLGI